MIPVLTVSQMRKIDEQAIGKDPDVGFRYMLRAGEGLFDAVRELVPDPKSGDVAILCGKGNNGGDGFTVGKLLIEAGYTIMCYALCQPEDLIGEAKIAFEKYDDVEGNFLVLDDVADLEALSKCSLIIDAILGTGIKGDPHGVSAEVIEAINNAGVRILSVDTPSGLDNDTGAMGQRCVKATMTVAMGFPKIGSFFYPGRSHVGILRHKALGYADTIVEKNASSVFLPELDELKKMLPPRKPAGSKFDHGLCLMLCGSRGMIGSAALASISALRSGCGMVHLASPESAVSILATKLTEVVLHGIEETKSGTPALAAAEFLLEKSTICQALCVGPGLSHEEETARLVRRLVENSAIPVVLDADGINAYKGKSRELGNHAAPLVITPHSGEWSRLFGTLPPRPADMAEALHETAKKYDMTILCKGNPTVVAAPSGSVFLSPYGNSGMATAGCGDVLSGIITSLVAQGVFAADAAVLGAFIHAKAGDAARDARGEYSMIASDVMDNIHKAIQGLTGQ
jgi:ADP-dependent NAD(P)H-hydrate dehydratase / NAD(P)H-hydrate epimerase